MTRFDELTSPAVAELRDQAVVLLPLGAVEAHGPHGPLGTDTLISEGMCRRAADALANELPVLVMPTLPYGVTTYAAAFPGTVTISAAALRAMLTDICTGLRDQGLRRIVLVNNHFEPEHLATVRAVADELGIGHLDLVRRRNAQRIGGEFATGSCHAGRYETSLVLADAPELVGERAGLPAVTVDLPAQMSAGHKDFRSMGMADAYCGAPADATEDEGAATFAVLTELLVEAIREEATK
ncbi:creatininase family protein [Labedaea rhizosphaerae]|uniref:Creatinine amidohydrolase n=1 Tax=Labedaea rhizosphaerae TaxID=598644 RepID=A0A4R6SJ65_LABRH|nr:creatininase family protein [Labedaea rhizosphaerae]TDQ01048.1 creatinine amidohydrolase [Labedaea rhizosphaerae]